MSDTVGSEKFDRVAGVMRDVFKNDDLEIARETSPTDIEEWDSLHHVTLLIAVEKAFGVKFSSAEIGEMSNVGQMVDIIEQRTKG